MKKNIVFLLLCGALLLSGCGLLRREYSRTEPHSATYYEGDRRDVLRAESYQDLVNDLLLLVAAHAEEGTVWYYAEEETDLSREAQRACAEVQQETPLGAYALDYLTYTVDDGAGATPSSASPPDTASPSSRYRASFTPPAARP